jgi:hypothetical protein
MYSFGIRVSTRSYTPADWYFHFLLVALIAIQILAFQHFREIFRSCAGFDSDRANLMNLSRTGRKLPWKPKQPESSLITFVHRIFKTSHTASNQGSHPQGLDKIS